MADKSSVLIRRKKIFKDKEEEGLDDSVENNSESDANNDSGESDKRYAKAFSIILFAFAILLFVSLISYSVKDEANALTPISELFGLFTNDESIKFKAETTENWLGIVGSIISYHLYNSIFGIAVLGLPIFLVLFAKEIWQSFNLSEKTLKNFSVYLLLSVLFATIMAVINTSDIFGLLPKELSGNIGFFLSNVLTNIMGHFGSFLLLFALIITTVIIGTNLKIDGVVNKFIAGLEQIGPKSKELYDLAKEKKAEYKDKKNSNKDSSITEDNVPDTNIDSVSDNNKEDNSNDYDSDLENNNLKDQDKEINEVSNNEKSEIENDANITAKPRFRPLSIKYTDTSKESSSDSLADDSNQSNTKSEPSNHKPSAENFNRKNADSGMLETSYESKTANDSNEKYLDEETNESKSTKSKFAQNVDFESELNDLDSELDELENAFSNTSSKDTESNIKESESQENTQPKQIQKPKLILDVEENETDDTVTDKSTFPISTFIHDEEINYSPPTFSLLKPPVKHEGVDDDELEMNARILQEKLETFKIHIENLEITPGPVVTQYAFQPAAGIKISKIESLADDLAMALKAKGIRIIAPIPGKGLVGIEIPNNNPTLVRFSSVVSSKKFLEEKLHLPIALGKTISGETAFTDLAKTPHLLMAGATGSGKSVGVNTVINSLLYTKLPSELKFVIIDPKKVELGQYKALKNHYIAMSPDVRNPIITDPVEAVAVLKSTVMEMEKRYDILQDAGQRNIADYNDKVRSGKYDNDNMNHRPMPYIVVIVDEYADLMLTSGKEIEQPIVMLAQKARAVGIHLVLATQRPSVDVITGLIKANFPSRIAYLVASKVDSRTILDQSGAEQLLGMGDMLFMPAGKPSAERIQNAFISTDEVDAICDHIGNQKGYSEPYWLPSLQDDASEGGGQIAASDRDPIFREAASLIIQTQQGSVSLIQRRLKVGYARAGRIMDELEDANIVGPFEGSKARQVLVESESDLEAMI